MNDAFDLGRDEHRLLMLCSRTQIDEHTGGLILQLLQKSIDWLYLKKMAIRHGVMPLVYRNLRSIGADFIPEYVIQDIKRYFLANTGRNLLLMEELLKIIDKLESSGIAAIPLKGPALAASLYGDVSLRQCYDLDILVRRHDMQRARDVMVSAGYDWISSLAPSQQNIYLRVGSGSCTFRKNGTDLMVEIDRESASPREAPFSVDLEPLWERAIWTVIEGKRVRIFTPEDLLLVLSVHGGRHRWDRLIWICDIAELIDANPGMDWCTLINRAHTSGCRRVLFIGLLLSHDLLGTMIPGDVLDRVERDRVVISLARDVISRLLATGPRKEQVFELVSFYLRASDSFRKKTDYCLRLIFTPTVGDMQLVSLPRLLSPLYSLIHPTGLIAKYSKAPLRNLFCRTR